MSESGDASHHASHDASCHASHDASHHASDDASHDTNARHETSTYDATPRLRAQTTPIPLPRNEQPSSFQTTLYHQVQIKARDSFKFFVRADRPLDQLHFSFYTRRKNIAFGLFYLYQPQVGIDEGGQAGEWELPGERVRELIAASRDTVSIVKLGQEGSLGRACSLRERPGQQLLSGTGSRNASAENLSLTGESPALSELSHAMGTGSSTAAPSTSVGELMEILPITRHESYDYTVSGVYTIPLPGTFVLFFDNSFSIGTTKHLFYNAHLSVEDGRGPSRQSTSPPLLGNGQLESICAAGWLNKRRTGMMRSWARRWFQLDSSGVLSYYRDRASPLRGSLFVPDCSLIIARGTLRFSLDSGSNTFHLRALREDDFHFWMQVFSSFKRFGPPTTISSSHQLPRLVAGELGAAREAARMQLEAARGAPSMETLDAALGAIERLYQLVRARGENEGEDDEVFYDVQEIYVDAIDEGEDGDVGSGDEDEDGEGTGDEAAIHPASHPSEEEVFEAALDLGEEELRMFVSRAPGAMAGRELAEWLRTAAVELARCMTPLYRTKMPFPAPPITIGLASVLMRKSFPVELNEPVNLLQRMAEELEYCELLDAGAEAGGRAIEQLLHVAAFAVSGYASSVHRVERKPYNPLLGETFEYLRPDRGFRFVAEKVSHQPVIVACFAESRRWRFWQDVQAETRIWGKSMLITPKGRVHVEFLPDGPRYSWGKVSGALRNVYSSKKTVENHGELVVRNETTGDEARITFKESGIFSASGNEVHGGIFSAGGHEPVVRLRGRWDDMLCREVSMDGSVRSVRSASTDISSPSDNLLQVLWRVNPMPTNHAQFFNLSFYAITLNDLPELLGRMLPCTDSRFRPDQRLLESGMIDAAEQEKQRLEQLQRRLRSEREATGCEWTPRWFAFDSHTQTWIFTGRYWEARAAGFSNCGLVPLW